jgi:DNA-binding transcriptional ArsR family regulator
VPPDEELEGTTLRVYLAVIKEDGPVGPRDIMRNTSLSSPSVAYRHLQKLEALGLIEKDRHGEYTVKQRQSIRGHVWIGRRLVPRLAFYSFFFMGVLSIEVVIVAIRLLINEPLQYDFILLVSVTAAATLLFLVEGIFLRSKLKNSQTARSTNQDSHH